jgi:RHS repeat-associated protein
MAPRTYNSIGQMTQLQSGSSVNVQYGFHATQNNGKILTETDVISGETVTYAYDSLNRLASATSSVNPGWGQGFTYDGFGNLTNVSVTKGSAPTLSATYSASTNRRTTDTADANGNIFQNGITAYDVANRVARANISGGEVRYSYGPGNKRVWRGTWVSGSQTVDEITFYSAGGAKLCAYDLSTSGSDLRAAVSGGYYEYFGGKLLKNAQGWVNQDRLGSIGKFYPYGQERPSASSNGKEKFATYFRDSETGLDYAQNRYHSAGDGRFLTADPYQASAGVGDPGSWNRYAYVQGDPVNGFDPSGLQTVTGISCDPNEFVCINANPGPGIDHSYCYYGPPYYNYVSPTCTPCPGGFDENGNCQPAPPDEQTAKGTPTSSPSSEAIVAGRIQAATYKAAAALASKPGCAKLFNDGPEKDRPTAMYVLQSLREGTWAGSIKPGALVSPPGTVRTAITQPVAYNNGRITRTIVNITINTNAGAFVSGSAEDQAIAILHELGHAMNAMYGPATAKQIVTDGASVKDGVSWSEHNTALIKKECF